MPLLKLENLLLNHRYLIRRRLKPGSYAEICEAFDQQEQCTVIIKALNPALRGTPDELLEEKLRTNFAQEARVLETLCHPHIVQLLDHGEGEDSSGVRFPYLALEYLAGGDLHTHCRHTPLALAEMLHYFQPVVEALATAHSKAVIHRDLTPSNLLLSADQQQLKISDFGVAKIIGRSRDKGVTRVGTDIYAPPEHHPNEAESHEPLTPAADVYSLAKTILFALTGKAPLEFRHRPIDHLPSALADQAPRLLATLHRATAHRVSERYASVEQFWSDVAARAEEQPKDETRVRRNRIVIDLKPSEREAETVEHPAAAAKALPLSQLAFEVVRVNADIRARQTSQARCFAADLGNKLALEMLEIPAGTFFMGAPPTEAERGSAEGPQHHVTLPSFFMSRFPITQAQWRAVAQWPQVRLRLSSQPSSFKGDLHPVETVSWHEAVEFCERLARRTGQSYRLPSEAEWEYACRAGTTTPFHFGATMTPDLACYDGQLPYGSAAKGTERFQTTPVGSFGVANAFGLSELHGNVWEWCADGWHDHYGGAPTDGSAWQPADDATPRVVRGGSWFNAARLCRSAYRFCFAPDSRRNDCGFRVAFT